MEKLNLWPFYNYALEVLREKPVMSKQDLEQAIQNHFQQDFTTLHLQTIKGKQRTRWENLVDWVKARLTKDGLTATYGDTIIFCEPVGQIRGVGNLVRQTDFDMVVSLLATQKS